MSHAVRMISKGTARPLPLLPWLPASSNIGCCILCVLGPDKTAPAKLGSWPGDGDDKMYLDQSKWTSVPVGDYSGGIGAMEGVTFSGQWTHQPNKVEVMLPAGNHVCQLTTTDTYGATHSDNVNVNVNAEPDSHPHSRL